MKPYFRQRNNKLLYYLQGFSLLLIPKVFFRMRLNRLLGKIPVTEQAYIFGRVNFYNNQQTFITTSADWDNMKALKLQKKGKPYFFDTYSITRYFRNYRANFLFGDIDYIPERMTFLKSRKISEKNQNAILLKLNKVRHFLFINDPIPLKKKQDKLFGRAAVNQPQRISFYQKYFNHPMCNLGQINKGTTHDQWLKPKVSIREHLAYKFILCIEGYDVASNLKWVMSSNSIAVMPRPSCETWFMEGRLRPNYHYIEIKKDYSDLEEQLKFYMNNQNKMAEIVRNANEYTNQFKNKKRERLIALLVMEKFLVMTQQKKSIIDFQKTNKFQLDT